MSNTATEVLTRLLAVPPNQFNFYEAVTYATMSMTAAGEPDVVQSIASEVIDKLLKLKRDGEFATIDLSTMWTASNEQIAFIQAAIRLFPVAV